MERGKLVMSGAISDLGKTMTSRKMSVKWRNQDEKALEILRGANVKNLETMNNGATFDFNDGTDALDELLKSLVVQGVRISEWRGVGDDLEQIFCNPEPRN